VKPAFSSLSPTSGGSGRERLASSSVMKRTVEHLCGMSLVTFTCVTLIPVIKKTVEMKLDWERQVPLSLDALRLAPNNSMSHSPFKLVFGSI